MALLVIGVLCFIFMVVAEKRGSQRTLAIPAVGWLMTMTRWIVIMKSRKGKWGAGGKLHQGIYRSLRLPRVRMATVVMIRKEMVG